MSRKLSILFCLMTFSLGGQTLDNNEQFSPTHSAEFFSLWNQDFYLTPDPFQLLDKDPRQSTITEVINAMIPERPPGPLWFSHQDSNDPTVDEGAWARTFSSPSEVEIIEKEQVNWSPTPMPRRARKVFPHFQLPPVQDLLPLTAMRVPSHVYRKVRYEGLTVFSEQDFHSVSTTLLGKPIDIDDLSLARDLITRTYLENGFINSGAVGFIEDPITGTLTFRIKEGELGSISINNRSEKPRLKNSYLEQRIRGIDNPLKFEELQRTLQILQLNPNIDRLNAELKPGPTLGQAILELELEEAKNQWSWGVDFHNSRPVAVGSFQAEGWLQSSNFSGMSDTLTLRSGLLSGEFEEPSFSAFENLSLKYVRPILSDDTSLEFGYSSQDYALIQAPFDALDIQGESHRYLLGMSRPIFRSLSNEVVLRASLEHQRSRTSLLGEPFSLSPGFVDGELNLTTLRLGGSWLKRTAKEVFALDTRLNVGLQFLGATDSSFEPDATFLSWTTSSQYVRRIGDNGDRFLLRANAQLAFDSIPSSEQQSLGGPASVRGYRPNRIVSDSGFSFGAEYHWVLPIIPKIPDLKAELVPFFDYGYGWNYDDDNSESLCSVGLGISMNYSDWLRAQIFYGFALTNRSDQEDSLSDQGLHLKITMARF